MNMEVSGKGAEEERTFQAVGTADRVLRSPEARRG